MEPRNLYLCRHGQRIDAVNRNWRGPDDNPHDPYLTEHGHWQAQRLGERLQQIAIDAIFVSPYRRALQTAHAIAQALDRSFYVEAGIGEWQSKQLMASPPDIPSAATSAAEFPIDLAHETLRWPTYPENAQDVTERYQQTVNDLLATYPGHLLIVAHGKVVTSVAAGLVNQPEYQMRYGLACLTQLVYDGERWQLALNGDTGHLEGVTAPQVV